jgi:EVE domain
MTQDHPERAHWAHIDRILPPGIEHVAATTRVPYSAALQTHSLEREVRKPMTESTGRAFWIVVGSPGNFDKTRELGFTVQGLKSRHRKKAERMKPGDKIAYYVTGRRAFAAVSTITSPYFESHEPIWKSSDPKKDAEDYPFRVETSLDLALDDADFIDAEPIARQMEYARKWPAANWTLAFQGNVHEIGEADFALIRAAIEAKASPLAI